MSTAMFTVPSPAIPKKLQALKDTAGSLLLERGNELECAVNALISGRHMCMIGPPGIAKSYLVRTLVRLIADISDEEYFEWFVTKFSTPEELFGTLSLKALENDRHVRNITRKLPEAKVAFIDEIFETSSALLNTFLPVLNERLFYNDDKPLELELGTVFCASNKTPEESSELAALWDRITFRCITSPLKQDKNFIAVLKMATERFKTNAVPEPVISWDELLTAKKEVLQVEVPDDVYDALNELRKKLATQEIVTSDRRYAESIPIIQAQAYRDGRMMADVEDMKILTNVLWRTQKDIPVVEKCIFELANPWDKKALEIRGDVERLARQIDDLLKSSEDPVEKSRKAMIINGKLEQAAAELKQLRKEAKAQGRKSDLMDQVKEQTLMTARRVLRDVYSETIDKPEDDDE